MSLLFDHLVVKVNDLPTAIQTFSAKGFTVNKGGVHRGGLSENALIMFSDGSFIELLAIRRGLKPFLLKMYAKTRGFISLKYSKKWGLFQRFYDRALSLPEGVTDFCLFAEDLSAELQRIDAAGLFVTRPLQASRRKPDGSVASWQMASTLLAELPFLRGPYSPFIAPSAQGTTHANGITGIQSVVLLALDFKEMRRNLSILLQQEAKQEIGVEDREARFSLGSATLLLAKSSENDALIREFRGKGLGVFGIEWKYGTSGARDNTDFSNLHGLAVL